ncbi:MAG TPA: right-handed parallel beta-helix repeat-containing protein [Thermoanaerobaculia bacterium]
MRKVVLSLVVFAMVLLFALPVQAQATRTWVSGVGDDANPCSRTAPCKTFAGAISKTATGGEINVLDPGGFGGVTITKSITISAEGVEAGVLVSGTNAIVINATTTSNVVLRGLDIEGLGTGLVGIKVLGGLASLHVENCTINAFRGTNGSGIEIAPTTAGTTKVFIKDTTVRNSGLGTGAGIFFNPSGVVTVKGMLENVRMENNTIGLKVQGSTSNVSASHSVAAGNSGAGFSTVSSGAALTIERCVSTQNSIGVNCNAGSSVTLGNTSLSNNSGGDVAGLCTSFQNNDIFNPVGVNPVSPQ